MSEEVNEQTEQTEQTEETTEEIKEPIKLGNVTFVENEYYPMLTTWLRHEDGSYTPHIFTAMEIRRSILRATSNPGLCRELNINSEDLHGTEKEEG